MIVGVFARPDHPEGYYRHGYVCLAVLCRDEGELSTVRKMLMEKPYLWPGRNGDGWYDGKMDFLFAVPISSEVIVTDLARGIHDCSTVGAHRSLGDNRAFAYVSAKEVLGA